MNNMIPFAEQLELQTHDFLTAVGGGGKTSLLRKVGLELLAQEKKVLLTTTTHIRVPREFPGPAFMRDGQNAAEYIGRVARCTEQAVLTGEYIETETQKIKGAEDNMTDLLYQAIPDRIFLCEADGTAGHSFKIFRPHEPVIPKSTTRLVFVVGADAWQQPCKEVLFHCPEEIRECVFDREFWQEELNRALKRIRTMYNGEIDLLINKAEEERRTAAFEMAEAVRGLAERMWICSLQEGWMEPV